MPYRVTAAAAAVVVTTFVALAGACGPGASSGAAVPAPETARPTASPTATRTHSLIATLRENSPPGPVALQLVDLNGKVVASLALPRDGSTGSGRWWVGHGRRGVYILSPGGSLSLFEADGVLHPMGTIPGAKPDDIAGLAESPDGSQWMYSVVSYAPPDEVATSKIYVASESQPARLVGTLERPNIGSAGHRYLGGYQVLRWDLSGVLLGSRPTQVGGGGPFIGEGYGHSTVVRMNLDTGKLSDPLVSDCRFADVATDGTIACVSDATVKIVRSDGSTSSVTTSEKWTGHAAFLQGSSTLTYAVARYTSSDESGWTDTLFVATVGSGAPSSKAITPRNSVSSSIENPDAFDGVVDDQTIAGITSKTGATDFSQLYLALFTTGGDIHFLAPASQLIGVL